MAHSTETLDPRRQADEALESLLSLLLDEPLSGAFKPAALTGELPVLIAGSPATLSVGATGLVTERAYRLAAQRATPLITIRTADPSSPPPLLLGTPAELTWSLELAGLVPRVVLAIPPLTEAMTLELASADLSLVLQVDEAPAQLIAQADHTVSPSRAASLLREFLTLLPRSADHGPLRTEPNPPSEADLLQLVPFEIDGAYSMDEVVSSLLDAGHWLPLRTASAPEVLTALGRLDGHPVGLVASRPALDNGRLTAAGCGKVARHVKLCDAFHLPIIFLVDTEGIAASGDDGRPTLEIVEAAINATFTATIPKATVIVGRAYGLGALIMAAVAGRADYVAAWPRAELALLAPSEVATSSGGPPPDDHHQQAAVRRAARSGAILDVIHPAATRSSLASMLELLRGEKRYNRGRKESLHG